MNSPRTPDQEANLQAIMAKAKVLVDANKRKALEEKDFDSFFGIGERWRQVEESAAKGKPEN